jgi:hypothetical protein
VSERGRAAAAGAAAALVWAAVEPLDSRLFRSDYRDVALLGKLVTRGRGWLPAGLVLHAGNGAVFGLVFDALRRRTGLPSRRLALGLALAEHVSLYPLGVLVDRRHPRRGERHLPPLMSLRVFGQETFRHVLFGLVLGQLATGKSARPGDGTAPRSGRS